LQNPDFSRTSRNVFPDAEKSWLPAIRKTGIFASFIYNAAKYNNESIYRLLYGMLFAAFILSNANDTFFVHLSLWVQIIIYSVFLKKLLYFNRVNILRYAKK